MVGYVDDHSPGTYWMYNPQTSMVHLTCNVWAEWKCTDPSDTLTIFHNDENTKHSSPVGAADDDKPEFLAINFPAINIDISADEVGEDCDP